MLDDRPAEFRRDESWGTRILFGLEEVVSLLELVIDVTAWLFRMEIDAIDGEAGIYD